MPTRLAPSSGRTLFRAPVAIFWTGFLLRFAAIVIGHTFHVRATQDNFTYGYEAGRIARSLVTGHGYGNPFNGPSGPTAWLPPLYPLLLALGFKLFGVYSRGAALFIMTLDSIFSALIAPAMYEIAARCFDAYGLARRASTKAAPVALWSAWFWALYPAAMQYAVHWIWEMSLSTCLFSWALVFALRLRGVGRDAVNEGPTDMRPWLVLGLLWGCIALSNASLLSMLPVSLAWILWPRLRQRSQLVKGMAGAAVTCLVTLLVMLPWMVRNERAFHAFVPTRSNFGIEFWRSTQFDLWGPIPWGTAMPLSSHEPEFQRYVAEGELRYAHEKGELAKANIRRRPQLFVENTLMRTQFFWFGTPAASTHPVLEYLRIFQFSITSLCGLLGLFWMLRQRVPGAGLFALSLGVMPLVYYAVTAQARFRHPLEPLLTIAGVYLFRSTGPRQHGDSAAKETPAPTIGA